MKPRLRIVAGRPVTINEDTARLSEARRRFSLATGESHRLFNFELGSHWQGKSERVLTRSLQKLPFLNVKGLA